MLRAPFEDGLRFALSHSLLGTGLMIHRLGPREERRARKIAPPEVRSDTAARDFATYGGPHVEESDLGASKKLKAQQSLSREARKTREFSSPRRTSHDDALFMPRVTARSQSPGTLAKQKRFG